MRVHTRDQDANRTMLAIGRESFDYWHKKPGRIPPADSPSRPNLARLGPLPLLHPTSDGT